MNSSAKCVRTDDAGRVDVSSESKSDEGRESSSREGIAMDLKELQQHIRTLATLDVSEDLVVTCYLDVERGVQSCRTAFTERVALLRRAIVSEHETAFEEALARIVSFIKNDLRPDSKGVAVFARGGCQPFFLPLQFRVPVPTSIAVGATPIIYHLVELKDTYHRYVIMLCTEERIRILEVNLGAVTAEVWKERPELRERVGREWTKQHYQSHRRERTRQFIKETIQILDQRMSAGGFTHLILAGSPRISSQVSAALPKHLASVLVDSIPAPGREKVSLVVEATLSSFIEQEQDESASIAARLRDEIYTNGLAVIGSEACRKALEQGQVDVLVLATEHSPEDKEALVKLAEQQDCGVELVNRSDVLMQLGGVGCLLRYQVPES